MKRVGIKNIEMRMHWKLFFLFSILLATSMFSSCIDDNSDYNLAKKAYILSLKVDKYPGMINVQEKTIEVCIPDETFNVHSVTPELVLPEGATYTPQGAVDMSEPVVYTVSFGSKASEVEYKVGITLSEGPKIEVDANRVFFSPCGNLKNHTLSGVIGDEDNGSKFFDYTYGWTNTTDSLVWGLDLLSTGKLNITPVLGVPEAQDGSVVELMLQNEKQEITLKSTGKYTTFEKQQAVSFDIAEPGRYILKMMIKNKKEASTEVAYAKSVLLSGEAAFKATPVILRWRPAATHCQFRNSDDPSQIEVAIYEVTINSDYIDSYNPITSKFGYFGSTWDSRNKRFGGINFSLWSFSQTPPPAEQFSHLIAVGKNLYIDGFNHEGTGVKPRGDNPYEKMTGERTQALALKKVPGVPYDVFYGYYWDTNVKEWILFGCGKKYNASGIEYLTTGSFVEQPGIPEVQRSCHIKREIAYRGWFIDKNQKLYPANVMLFGGNDLTNSYKNWKISDDNKFIMQMGGFDKITKIEAGELKMSKAMETPLFLSPEHLAVLGKLPIDIQMLKPTNIEANAATVNFKLDKLGTNPVVKIYWGKSDGLTFVDKNVGNGGVVKWENNITLTNPTTSISHKLEGLDGDTEYYYRLQITNEEGETWSWDSGKFKTLEGEKPSEPEEPLSATLSFKAVSGHVSQEGNVITIEDPYNNVAKVNFIVNDIPNGYPWSVLGLVKRRNNVITNITISLDGQETEIAAPNSKGYGNFASANPEPTDIVSEHVHYSMDLGWSPLALKNNAFADSYVAYGGFLQYDITFDLYDSTGNPIMEKAVDGKEPKQASTVVTLKSVNKNPKGKAIHMNKEIRTIKKSEIPADGIIFKDYDLAKAWKETFGEDMPNNLLWKLQYYSRLNQGFFARKINGSTPIYSFLDQKLGKVILTSNKAELFLSPDITPGVYAYRFIAKSRTDVEHYAIFDYNIKVE